LLYKFIKKTTEKHGLNKVILLMKLERQIETEVCNVWKQFYEQGMG
jgi:hypothetical protein